MLPSARSGQNRAENSMTTYLYHFSEDQNIEVFEPRVAPTQQVGGAYVWADDERLCFRYWFPRDCRRATWWRKDGTSHPTVAIQWDWYDRFVACRLYAYRFDGEQFRANPGGGGWITEATIAPIDVTPVGPLLDRHRDA